MAMESGNYSEDTDYLLIPFDNYGNSSISGGEVSDLNSISLLERLNIENLETSCLSTGKTQVRTSEAWLLRRIEPFGPVDYLEYHHRIN
ncbi:MAG: hypothetical protein JWP00_1448 [Chloroflexi bacterium]|jgi:hypothetical protein|nr:hypothetical protein [Chloroflexota bacterium]